MLELKAISTSILNKHSGLQTEYLNGTTCHLNIKHNRHAEQPAKVIFNKFLYINKC